MPASDERRELIPVTVAAIVAAISVAWLWSDLRSEPGGGDDPSITSAVLSRAGATVIPSERPAHLVVPLTVPVGETSTSTVGRAKP